MEKSGVSCLVVVDDGRSNAGAAGTGAGDTAAGVWIGAAVWTLVAPARGDGAGIDAGDGAWTVAGVAVGRGATGTRPEDGGRTEADEAGMAIGASSITPSES
jgi:hypothetical protein